MTWTNYAKWLITICVGLLVGLHGKGVLRTYGQNDLLDLLPLTNWTKKKPLGYFRKG